MQADTRVLVFLLFADRWQSDARKIDEKEKWQKFSTQTKIQHIEIESKPMTVYAYSDFSPKRLG